MTRGLLILLLMLMLLADGFGQSNTNIGNEFWVAFPPNSSPSAVKQLYISSSVATSGTIESAVPGVNQVFSVTPGIVTQITLPTGVALFSGIENKGIHIVANDPIAVYGLNNQTATTDAFLALPVSALGLDYRVMTYTTAMSGSGSAMAVVATQDGTSVTVFNHQTGVTSNIPLNAGQTYYEEAPAMGEDLTGSRIQSNFPVAVMGAVEISQIPVGCTFADHIVEEMFPCYSWGLNYVTVPLAGRDNSGDIFRVLAAEDGTEVSVNGTLVATINAGDHYETPLAGFNTISCTKASLVAQFAKGEMCSGGALGDPMMMLILPREQYLTDYTIINVAGVTPFDSHWVNLVAPDYALGTIYRDGVLIPAGLFVPIGTSGYYGAQLSMTQGSHTFNSTFPFGVSVYGWRTVDSYGYPGGGSMSPVATVNAVSLTPDTLYGELNVTSVCLTAQVVNTLNQPVEGILVNFYISGINPVVGNGYTDASGNATYCYTQIGTVSGIDHVYAEAFGILSDTSVVYWNYLCNDPVDGGTIAGDQTGCDAYTPLPLLSTSPPTGMAGTLEYLWQQSVVSGASGFTDIPGTDAPDYAPGLVTQTTWFRRLARVSCKPDWSGAAPTNVLEITVVPSVPMSVSITASDTAVCAGTPVTISVTTLNAGPGSSFEWHLNGSNSLSTDSVLIFVPADGDRISCTVTSTSPAPCLINNPASTDTITLTVNPLLPVSVTVAASVNPVCAGLPVTFTATPVNGGITPAFQWQVNGVNAGANNPVYTFVPVNGDIVTCTLTSSETCTSGNPAPGNPVPVSVIALPVVSFTACFDTITTTNAKPISLKGGIPLGGTYSGPGVSGGYFYPNMAGAGTHIITYTYVNAALCSNSTSSRIHEFTNPIFNCGNNWIDIRDGKRYPTIQIGSQCWFAADLDYGVQITETIHQRDNCIAEKYVRPSSLVPRPSYYQWDELMRYNPTPAAQGLCPPGWHVPTEAEWILLFSNWTGNGYAGSPLKYSGYSGFNAFLSGARHETVQWDFQDFAVFFWSSDSHGPYRAWAHGMNDPDPSVSSYPSLRSNAFSVRCIRD